MEAGLWFFIPVSHTTAYQETVEVLRGQLREAVIDHAAFEQKIRACELSRCRATCCHDGVYLSEEEAAGIEVLLEKNPALGESVRSHGADTVFEQVGNKIKTATRPAQPDELAADYPGHFPKTRCVFLDTGGHCMIQVLSVQQGRHPWFDKPLTCWIHPLVILPATRDRARPILTLVSPENDPQKTAGYPGFASCTHCGRPDEGGKKARQVLAAELEMLGAVSGRDILGELNAEVWSAGL